MVDFGDEEYKQMLCVDGAAIEKPITLKPEEEWTGRLQLSVLPSSFCNEYLNFYERSFEECYKISRAPCGSFVLLLSL